MKHAVRQPRAGVTLIELLCVIVIIGILVGLLLGPVHRAYRRVQGFAGEMEGPPVVELGIDRLRRYSQNHKSFEKLTAEVLHKRDVFDSKFMQYIRERKIVFFPFSSKDPDSMVILSYGFSKDDWQVVSKGQLSAPPREQ